MGRTMQISSPAKGLGRKHVNIGTSMSSKKRAAGQRKTLSQEDYSIFSPVSSDLHVVSPSIDASGANADCRGEQLISVCHSINAVWHCEIRQCSERLGLRVLHIGRFRTYICCYES